VATDLTTTLIAGEHSTIDHFCRQVLLGFYDIKTAQIVGGGL